MRWVKHELTDECATLETTESIARLRDSLADSAVAIVDFDSLTFEGSRVLLKARVDGWRGFLVALGDVDYDERRSLGVRASVPRPFGSERLRKAVGDLLVRKKRNRLPTLMRRAAVCRSEFTRSRDL
jgi:hypothetical protein